MIEWIDVEDDLPEYEKTVLIKTQNGITQGYLYRESDILDTIGGELIEWDQWHDVIHDDDFEDGFVIQWTRAEIE